MLSSRANLILPNKNLGTVPSQDPLQYVSSLLYAIYMEAVNKNVKNKDDRKCDTSQAYFHNIPLTRLTNTLRGNVSVLCSSMSETTSDFLIICFMICFMAEAIDCIDP